MLGSRQVCLGGAYHCDRFRMSRVLYNCPTSIQYRLGLALPFGVQPYLRGRYSQYRKKFGRHYTWNNDGRESLWNRARVNVRQNSVRLWFHRIWSCHPQAECDSTHRWSTFRYS